MFLLVFSFVCTCLLIHGLPYHNNTIFFNFFPIPFFLLHFNISFFACIFLWNNLSFTLLSFLVYFLCRIRFLFSPFSLFLFFSLHVYFQIHLYVLWQKVQECSYCLTRWRLVPSILRLGSIRNVCYSNIKSSSIQWVKVIYIFVYSLCKLIYRPS